VDGNLVSDDREVSEILNKFFASVFTVEDTNNIPQKAAETDKILGDIQITIEAVRKKIKNLKADSAPGPDGFHPRLLKELVNELSLPLTILFRRSLDENKIPQDWKEAVVTPIYKKGTKSDPGNYRPVSLTSVPCKLLESIINDAITEHLNTNKLINDSQHGFMAGRSCTTNMLEFMNMVTSAIDEGEAADIFYLDFSKAFDKVPKERLMVKVRAKGIRGKVADWLHNWLSGRKQVVRVRSGTSSKADVKSGVPQGTILGPCLFKIHIDDIDEMAALLELLSKFADDTKGLKVIRGEQDCLDLQTTLDKLCEWAAKWGMAFNTDKCKIMHIGRNNPEHRYFMHGQELKTTEEEKDIGILVNKTLKPANHCDKAANTALGVLSQITRNFHFRDRHVFMKLYKQYVRPHVEFATPVWSPWLSADRERIEKVQSKAVQMVSGLKGTT
jgi:Reverse transcriptase (RNA-dependent DNA polymerase)